MSTSANSIATEQTISLPAREYWFENHKNNEYIYLLYYKAVNCPVSTMYDIHLDIFNLKTNNSYYYKGYNRLTFNEIILLINYIKNGDIQFKDDIDVKTNDIDVKSNDIDVKTNDIDVKSNDIDVKYNYIKDIKSYSVRTNTIHDYLITLVKEYKYDHNCPIPVSNILSKLNLGKIAVINTTINDYREASLLGYIKKNKQASLKDYTPVCNYTQTVCNIQYDLIFSANLSTNELTAQVINKSMDEYYTFNEKSLKTCIDNINTKYYYYCSTVLSIISCIKSLHIVYTKCSTGNHLSIYIDRSKNKHIADIKLDKLNKFTYTDVKRIRENTVMFFSSLNNLKYCTKDIPFGLLNMDFRVLNTDDNKTTQPQPLQQPHERLHERRQERLQEQLQEQLQSNHMPIKNDELNMEHYKIGNYILMLHYKNNLNQTNYIFVCDLYNNIVYDYKPAINIFYGKDFVECIKTNNINIIKKIDCIIIEYKSYNTIKTTTLNPLPITFNEYLIKCAKECENNKISHSIQLPKISSMDFVKITTNNFIYYLLYKKDYSWFELKCIETSTNDIYVSTSDIYSMNDNLIYDNAIHYNNNNLTTTKYKKQHTIPILNSVLIKHIVTCTIKNINCISCCIYNNNKFDGEVTVTDTRHNKFIIRLSFNKFITTYNAYINILKNQATFYSNADNLKIEDLQDNVLTIDFNELAKKETQIMQEITQELTKEINDLKTKNANDTKFNNSCNSYNLYLTCIYVFTVFVTIYVAFLLKAALTLSYTECVLIIIASVIACALASFNN